MKQSYSQTIEWLFQQFPAYQLVGGKAYKPGLDQINRLLESFGNPHHQLKFIHVAGTNGKGSTSSMLASILTESDYKVGLFTSPHIQDFRERIRVNGQIADEAFVIDAVEKIRALNLDFQPSFFEISFLMAVLYFRRNECDICVIETGLGGRLDATNCIQPILSLITNISLEHTQYLGNTIQEIAREKAGIIKSGVPVVIGERNDETDSVFVDVARNCHSPIYFSQDDSFDSPLNFPLLGSYQIHNFHLVLKGLQLIKDIFPLSSQAIHLGLKNLAINSGFYGRLQVMSEQPRVIFDVSHNAAGIEATLNYFKGSKSLRIVYGTSSDKDLDAIFPLFSKEYSFYFTEFSNERSAKIQKLKDYSEKYHLSAKFFKNSFEALNEAKSTANKVDTILVFGSFFLISDFFEKKL